MKLYSYKIVKTNLLNESNEVYNQKITASSVVADMARMFIGDQIDVVENFVVFYLSRNNKIIAINTISTGGVTGTFVDVKIILKYAISLLASGMILVHNHPSGNLQKSDADVEITKKIKNAASYIDINVLDHVIVTSDGYFSFRDEGLL
jgi:DNA repair protein RadC